MLNRYMNLPEFQNIMKRAKHLNTTSDSLALIYRLVNDGDGVTVFPQWFQESSKNLVCLDDLDFKYETEIYIHNHCPILLVFTNSGTTKTNFCSRKLG